MDLVFLFGDNIIFGSEVSGELSFSIFHLLFDSFQFIFKGPNSFLFILIPEMLQIFKFGVIFGQSLDGFFQITNMVAFILDLLFHIFYIEFFLLDIRKRLSKLFQLLVLLAQSLL